MSPRKDKEDTCMLVCMWVHKPAQTPESPRPLEQHTHTHTHRGNTHLSQGQQSVKVPGWKDGWEMAGCTCVCVCVCGWTDKWTVGVHTWMNGRTDLFPSWLPGLIDQPAPPRCIFNYLVRKQIRWGCGALRAQRWRQAAITQGPHQRPSIAAEDAVIGNWRKEGKKVVPSWFTEATELLVTVTCNDLKVKIKSTTIIILITMTCD